MHQKSSREEKEKNKEERKREDYGFEKVTVRKIGITETIWKKKRDNYLKFQNKNLRKQIYYYIKQRKMEHFINSISFYQSITSGLEK